MSCGTVPDYGNDEENGAVVLVGAGLSGLYDAGLRGTPLVLRVSPVEALRHWAERDASCAQSLPQCSQGHVGFASMFSVDPVDISLLSSSSQGPVDPCGILSSKFKLPSLI